MTNHMFQDNHARSGLDMAAQIIQQGRDHGLPGYTKWREFCRLPLVRNFKDLERNIPSNVVAIFQKIYK